VTTATDTKLHGEVQLGHICSYRVTVGAPEVIGPLAEGLRLNFYVTGGDIFGPKMRGRLGHKDSAQQPLPKPEAIVPLAYGRAGRRVFTQRFIVKGSTERLSKFPIDRCRTIWRHRHYCSFVQPATRFLPLNVGGFLRLAFPARILCLRGS
jgi:hypothetical protein